MSDRLAGAPWFAHGRPVVITGGRGFLGSHLALRLAHAHPEGQVVSIDNGTRDCFAALGVEAPPNLRFVEADVRDPGAWLRDIGRPSVVAHFAALAGVSTYYERPRSVLEVNGMGTARLLDLLVNDSEDLRPDLFLNVSTSEVYGPEAAGADESRPTPVGPVSDPRWTYAASKVFGEHWTFATARSTGLPVVSVRPFNVYGPGQVGEGAVRIFCDRAVRGETISVTGDGAQSRAWIYVDDFVDALLALARTPSSWGVTYNVGDPDTLVSTRELAERIVSLAESEAGITYVPHPGQDVMERWPRTDRLRGATDWVPRVGLDEGLSRTIEFWRSQNGSR
ncbi:MAG: NAD-dependent epimerase/dehydratase family protein [Deltaproteobacteria bacterium]|nr:NAD-dependent epimerase/dehydratase family protein [Deltaproteobacteria bacterium]